jgi:predicted nucleotidyltransferase component of viral defense system
MQDLIKQEQFELEVLDKLNSGKFLSNLVLGGGTMLRLCFGLDRFSVDLDFWIVKGLNRKKLFDRLKAYLGRSYAITDATEKFYTLLFELRSKAYPRSLKIEIRKEKKKIKTEQAIAYSKFSNIQVLLKVIPLKEMMKAKIGAFSERKEIRDLFDLEFLLKKGIVLDETKEALQKVLSGIESLSRRDYAVKLGSLLEEGERKYYLAQNFKLLRSAIQEKLRAGIQEM